jgi:hypothetical protein
MKTGLWTVAVGTDGKVYLEDNDFTHDVRLYVNGDFATPEQHWEYAGVLARKLNGTWTSD